MSLSLRVELLPPFTAAYLPKEAGYVVIDTLRFTTTATQALAAGARSIRAVSQIPEALALAAESTRNTVLLCGERHCMPIEGFDLGNSPLEYTADRILGLDLIFTTTNGTKAINSIRGFKECLLGALVNRTAIARRIIDSGIDDWFLICAGTDGQVAGEDILAAGAIIEALSSLLSCSTEWLTGDSSLMAGLLGKHCLSNPGSILDTILTFSGARQLLKAGYRQDVQFASQIDLLDTVPICLAEQLIFHPLQTSS